ncbi:MAG: tetracycline resistance MFS efflux pump [Leptolyngbya sp.]|jgi:MFS family permease|uniref:Tetracycline resistance MFS efflux pump n=1 Tax=Shackletoniella antarctica TaxID=268115 RepID=A0A2W4WB10_9CYAN|nr:MAG: tetracycline resistance MFS efflux pump [Shackletoniella antarctica]PZV11810.1 MAG: tetracycline resistance MFS efflux pump [Leptolyngbya sp.]
MSLTPVNAKTLSTPRLVFIFITILFDKLGESLIFPILPFLVERFRSDAFTLGMLASSYAIAQFIAIPVIGALSDRYGRRPVMLVCVLGTAISYFIFGFATTLGMLFFSRILDGVTGGVAATAQAYIADISAPEDRAKNFGITGAAFGLGFTLGPAAGGLLASINLNLPVFVAGTIALMNFGLGYFVLAESLDQDQRRPLAWRDFNPIGQLSDILRDSRIQGLLISFFIFNFAFAGFSSIFVLFLNTRYGWGPSQAAMVFFFIGIVSTLVQGGLIRWLLPRFGEAKLVVSGLVLVALAFGGVVLIPAGSPVLIPALYTTQAFLALGVGLLIPSLRGLISIRVSGQEQGKTLGGNQALQSVASIAGPLWAGWIFDRSGMLSPFWMGALFMVMAVGFALTNLPRRQLSV